MLAIAVIVGAGIAIVVAGSRSSAPGRDRLTLSVLFLKAYRLVSAPVRQEWVDAMIAEYDTLDARVERRRFARGCVLALLAAPAPRDSETSLVRRAIGLCVVVAVGLAVFGLVHYPGLRSGSSWIIYVALFGIGTSLYAFCGAQVSKLGTPSVHRIGMLAAVPALPCAWFVAYGSGSIPSGVNVILVLLPAAATTWVARRDRSAASGVVAALDAALCAGLLFFVGFVGTTYAISTGTPSGVVLQEFIHSGARDFRTWSIGDSLGGACFMLIFIPTVGLALGLLASWLAGRSVRPSPT